MSAQGDPRTGVSASHTIKGWSTHPDAAQVQNQPLEQRFILLVL